MGHFWLKWPAVGWVVLGISYAVGGPLLGIGLYLVVQGSFPGWWKDWMLKPIVRRFCDALDHRMLLPERCERLAIADDREHLDVRFRRKDGGEDRFLFPRRDCVLLPITNTSTERLAEHVAGQVVAAIAHEAPAAVLHRIEVEVEESRGQCGVYVLDLPGRA